MNKLVKLTTKATCLSVKSDNEILQLLFHLRNWLKSSSRVTNGSPKYHARKKNLQSLHRKLLYVTKCVQMLDTLRLAHKHDIIHLNIDFTRDLNWVTEFLLIFNGVTFLNTPTQAHVEFDASLQV